MSGLFIKSLLPTGFAGFEYVFNATQVDGAVTTMSATGRTPASLKNDQGLGRSCRFYFTPVTVGGETKHRISSLLFGRQYYLTFLAGSQAVTPFRFSNTSALEATLFTVTYDAAGGYYTIQRPRLSSEPAGTFDKPYVTMFFTNGSYYLTATNDGHTNANGRFVISSTMGTGPVRPGYLTLMRLCGMATAGRTHLVYRSNWGTIYWDSFEAGPEVPSAGSGFLSKVTFVPVKVPGVDGATKFTFNIRVVDTYATPSPNTEYRYMCLGSDDDGLYVESRDEPHAWEEFELVPSPLTFGRFLIKSCYFTDTYLSATASNGIYMTGVTLSQVTALAEIELYHEDSDAGLPVVEKEPAAAGVETGAKSLSRVSDPRRYMVGPGAEGAAMPGIPLAAVPGLGRRDGHEDEQEAGYTCRGKLCCLSCLFRWC